MKPILFSTAMVQAVMKGTKTQTRRVTGLKQINENPDKWRPKEINNGDVPGLGWACEWVSQWGEVVRTKVPYGFNGDIMWLRETWQKNCAEEGEDNGFSYKADGDTLLPWKPSIFMPKEACRTFLRIKQVGVQRLQDISHEHSIAEGIELINDDYDGQEVWKNYLDKRLGCFDNPRLSFKTLWESINGEGSWEDNPWIWVVEFEKCKKPKYWPHEQR